MEASVHRSQQDPYGELVQLLGDHITVDPIERSYYRRDLAAVPGFLGALIGRTLPDAIARPRNTDDVAALVRHASTHRIPITPRAAATTVYWNSVPMHGGLVLDMNGMRGLIGIDETSSVASVLPGTRWQELDQILRRRGYALFSYPTSAPSATVGGWVSMEGYGIGSLEFGALADQLVRLEVVLPDGRIIVAGTPGELPIDTFCGAEGTLGIITRIDLKIRRAPEFSQSTVISYDDSAAFFGAVADLASVHPTPYLVHFADGEYQSAFRNAGFEPPSEHATVMVTFEGDAAHVASGMAGVVEVASRSNGKILPGETAAHEWEERFLALRLKRSGPTVLGSEAWLGLGQLAAYAKDAQGLAKRQKLALASYGTVVKPGEATVMSLFPCDESRVIDYVLALSLTRQLFGTAFRHGGRPYGIGVWSSPYLHRAYSPAELADLRARKRKLDPLNIMNPGKVYSSPLLLSHPVFDIGMGLLAGIRRLTKVTS